MQHCCFPITLAASKHPLSDGAPTTRSPHRCVTWNLHRITALHLSNILHHIIIAGIAFTKTIHNDTYPFIDPLKSSSAHKSHSVFVTGASKGIGRRIALAYAQSGASKIALGARSSLDTLESEIIDAATKGNHPKPQVLKVQLDVLDKDSVERAAQEVEKAFGEGGLDILVNNAGWIEMSKPMGDADVDEWWYTWEVNIRGLFLVTHAFLPLVLKSKTKTIVNMSSNGAHWSLPGVRVFTFPSILGVTRLTKVRFCVVIIVPNRQTRHSEVD